MCYSLVTTVDKASGLAVTVLMQPVFLDGFTGCLFLIRGPKQPLSWCKFCGVWAVWRSVVVGLPVVKHMAFIVLQSNVTVFNMGQIFLGTLATDVQEYPEQMYCLVKQTCGCLLLQGFGDQFPKKSNCRCIAVCGHGVCLPVNSSEDVSHIWCAYTLSFSLVSYFYQECCWSWGIEMTIDFVFMFIYALLEKLGLEYAPDLVNRVFI